MKVYELIQRLATFSPDLEVKIVHARQRGAPRGRYKVLNAHRPLLERWHPDGKTHDDLVQLVVTKDEVEVRGISSTV